MNTHAVPVNGLVIRIKRALELLQISRSTAYGKWDPKSPQYDSSFPKRVRLGPNSVGLLVADIEAWVKAQAQESNGTR